MNQLLLECGALAGLTCLLFSAGTFWRSEQWKNNSYPPALTDIGRGSHFTQNVFVASIAFLCTLLPVLSASLQLSTNQTLISVAASFLITLSICLDGDQYGKQHSDALLAGGLLVAVWLWGASACATKSSMLFGAVIVVSFLWLYSIRQDKSKKLLFVYGEYVLLGAFLLFLGTLKKPLDNLSNKTL